jgi:hypothetical protein
MKFNSDIDIDFADRTQILNQIRHHPAGIMRDGRLVKHNTGVYVTDIPTDPFIGVSSIDYQDAEDRGYVKLDFLNVSLYQRVQDSAHLEQLMKTEPAWDRLYDPDFCRQMIHIGNHYNTLIQMPEAVNSIPRMMMFLAVIRPGKRHLIGLPWAEVAKTVWDQSTDGGYSFKKAHACAYAHLVVVNMNLLTESSADFANQGNTTPFTTP